MDKHISNKPQAATANQLGNWHKAWLQNQLFFANRANMHLAAAKRLFFSAKHWQ
jgi:hypothetical protein